MGQGMGGVWGAGMGFPGTWPVQQGNELDVLKTQAEALRAQLEQITKRIEQLEQGGKG
jgi:hypothetical protein